MDLDSLFDNAMKVADQRIENTMASKFTFHFESGESLELMAIFDTALAVKDNDKQRLPVVFEEGLLTVLNQRVDKSIKGAVVMTPLGERVVYDVFYSDHSTSLLQLSPSQSSSRGDYDGNLIPT
ncbi:hypothetical protein CGH51_06865 [Vibrio parahaemolyticus]|uniref:hypothetical protein n=1 Tax=Vibrio parahaemolyticus TaxID=670 RepID=UPI0003FBE52F|nr:hypothetical protein [Vibrio parahaemolyticus]TON76111.1 hypothetical protein CGH51_06865 [Vibrio parahaemolyticus]